MQFPVNSFFSTPTLPTEECYHLLRAVGVSSSDNTLGSVNRTLQDRIRQHGKQAFQITEMHAGVHDQIEAIFRSLGWLTPRSPLRESYDIIGVHGALVGAVRRRMDAVRQMIVGPVSEGGLQLSQLVTMGSLALLGSERTLVPDKESAEQLFDPEQSAYPFHADYDPKLWTTQPLKNEHDMMQLVRDQQLPDSISPEVLTTQSTQVNTGGPLLMLRELLRVNPGNRDLSILLVSSNPFVEYQDLVAQRILLADDSPFGQVETVGPMGPTPTATLLLDTWAKCIYELACAAGLAEA